MERLTFEATNEIRTRILQGEVGVIPTDTIYGLVGSALQPEVVERIYRLKQRTPTKPLIILIDAIETAQQLGVVLTTESERLIRHSWPGPVSLILPCPNLAMNYLHRETLSLGLRLPDNTWLRQLIAKTGPLVATSVNPEGQPPATTIDEAKRYFNGQVDFYLDGGMKANKPSALIDLTGATPHVIRGHNEKIL